MVKRFFSFAALLLLGMVLGLLPIEVKAGTQGGMKSLWMFMQEKKITDAVRCSLENFGKLEYCDKESGIIRNVAICPIYAISKMQDFWK